MREEIVAEVPNSVREWCELSEEEKHQVLPARYCIEECENLCLKGEIARTLAKEGFSHSEIEKEINSTPLQGIASLALWKAMKKGG